MHGLITLQSKNVEKNVRNKMIKIALPNGKYIILEKTAVMGRQLIRAARKIKSYPIPEWARGFSPALTGLRTGKIYLEPSVKGSARGLLTMHEAFEKKYLSKLKPAEKGKLIKSMVSPAAMRAPAGKTMIKRMVPGKVAPFSTHLHPGVLLREHNILATAKGRALGRVKKELLAIRAGMGETEIMKKVTPSRLAFELGKSQRLSRHAIKRLEPITEKRLGRFVEKRPEFKLSPKQSLKKMPEEMRSEYEELLQLGRKITKTL